MEPWKTTEMQDWARRFIEDERQAGRTYRMIPTDLPPDPPAGLVATWRLHSGNRILDVAEFSGLVMDFMRRNDIMPTDPDEIEDQRGTLTMAIQVYVRDVVQHGQPPLA